MKIYLGLLIFLFVGCTKEQITNYKANLSNTTIHTIVIRPYFGGSVPNNKIITLTPNGTFQIANGTDWGIVNNGGFDSDSFGGSDSIVVTFDNIYSITHYTTQLTLLASKYYLVSSNRNLYNKNSYLYTYQDPSKTRRESNYLYKFVEQDFLDTQ
jgi:hypothetical protein